MKGDLDKFLKNLPKIKEDKKRGEEETKKQEKKDDLIIDYNEERKEVYVMLWGTTYIFDQEGYKIFEKLWDKGVLKSNKSNYLCVKDDWNDLVPIHRYLKMKEVEELAKELNCLTKNVHVHHIKGLENNQLNNLEVLEMDKHAQRHGYTTWKLFQIWRDR